MFSTVLDSMQKNFREQDKVECFDALLHTVQSLGVLSNRTGQTKPLFIAFRQ